MIMLYLQELPVCPYLQGIDRLLRNLFIHLLVLIQNQDKYESSTYFFSNYFICFSPFK